MASLKKHNIVYENHDIAIAMSPSGADQVLGFYIQQGWLEEFKVESI